MTYDFDQLMQDTGKTEDELLGIDERRRSLKSNQDELTKCLKYLRQEIEEERPDVKDLKMYRDNVAVYVEAVRSDLESIAMVLRCSVILLLQGVEGEKLNNGTDLIPHDIEIVHRLRKLRVLATL